MILVIGGASTVGVHLAQTLSMKHKVCVLDSCITKQQKSSFPEIVYYEGDLENVNTFIHLFENNSIEAVLHLGATYKGECIEHYRKNIQSVIPVLQVMMRYDVKKFIFSSSAEVYGHITTELVTEEHENNPQSTFGRSLVMIEQILEDYKQKYDLNYIVLRNFEIVNSVEKERSKEEVITQILQQCAREIGEVKIDSRDKNRVYIRDYIHINDVAQAFQLAMNILLQEREHSTIYNVATGKGYSVLELIQLCEEITNEKVTNKVFAYEYEIDSKLIGCTKRIQQDLGWQTTYSIEQIIEELWKLKNTNYESSLSVK